MEKMGVKRTIITTLLALVVLAVGAKDNNDCILPMKVVVPQLEENSQLSGAYSRLESKVRQAVTQYGVDAGVENAEFCIVARHMETAKNVTSGLRALVSVTANIELYVANTITGEKYATTMLTVSGAGSNEVLAHTTAVGSLKPDNTLIQQFLKNARNKILEYYERQTPGIIRQAKLHTERGEFDKALFQLSIVPACYNKYADVEKAMREVEKAREKAQKEEEEKQQQPVKEEDTPQPVKEEEKQEPVKEEPVKEEQTPEPVKEEEEQTPQPLEEEEQPVKAEEQE